MPLWSPMVGYAANLSGCFCKKSYCLSGGELERGLDDLEWVQQGGDQQLSEGVVTRGAVR